MSMSNNSDLVDRLTEEVCEELPYNPPVSEVREKIHIYIQMGIDEEQAKKVTLDVFTIRREVLDELEFEEESIIPYNLPTYNRTDWR